MDAASEPVAHWCSIRTLGSAEAGPARAVAASSAAKDVFANVIVFLPNGARQPVAPAPLFVACPSR